jgi:hypothetical protein
VIQELATIGALTPTQRTELVNSSLGLDALSPELIIQVRDAYAHALRYVFAFFTAVSGFYFVTSFGIKEIPFRKDSAALEAEKRATKGDVERGSEKGDKDEGEGRVQESAETDSVHSASENDATLVVAPPAIGPDGLALKPTASRLQREKEASVSQHGQ